MRVVDAVAEILKREGVEYLSCFPTTPLIDAAAAAGIRPVLCRQEHGQAALLELITSEETAYSYRRAP